MSKHPSPHSGARARATPPTEIFAVVESTRLGAQILGAYERRDNAERLAAFDGGADSATVARYVHESAIAAAFWAGVTAERAARSDAVSAPAKTRGEHRRRAASWRVFIAAANTNLGGR